MIITVDTSENKSLQYIDEWNARYPKKAKRIEWRYQSLDAGDFESDEVLIELKIGDDLESSLNSGHLEEQLQYMLQKAHKIRHLVCIGTISFENFKRAVSLSQQYGTYCHHRLMPYHGIDCIVDLAENTEHWVEISVPIKRRDIEPSLVAALGYSVKGLSMACAAEIVGWRKTFEDLVEDLSAEKVQKIVFEFYGKEMQSLTEKVCKAIWGETA